MPLCHGLTITVDHVSGSREIELAASTITVLPNGVVHKVASHKARSPAAVVVCVEEDQFSQMTNGATPQEIRLAIGERHLALQRLLQAIAVELKGAKIGASAMIEGLSLQAGAVVAREFCASAAAVVKGGLSPWQLRQVVEFMRQNLATDIMVADIAAISGLSRFHFTRAFKDSTGIAPGQYLKQMRIERACDLLAQTELSIGDVAKHAGYDAPQAFSRLFRQAIGTSPREFRQAHRGE
jgi:AraC-like DNA-binding protein